MAHYEVQQIDIEMLKSKFNIVWTKLELANIYENINGVQKFNSDFKPIADISGELKGGSFSCDSTSDIRRTLNLDFLIKKDLNKVSTNPNFWINKFIISYIGVSNYYVENIKYYPLGVYIIDTTNYNFSLDDNSLSLSLVDLVALLNGDRDGVIAGMNSIKIEGCPEICPSTIYAIDSEDENSVVINIESNSYIPLTTVDEENSPYFDINVGFNINTYNLSKEKSYYDNFAVKISINGHSSYFVKELTVDGKQITFGEIDIGQDYVCNFGGRNSDEYCFILYGTPNTISGAMRKTIEQFSSFKYLIEEIGSDISTFDGSNATYVPYDLEFDINSTQWDVITKLRDLYAGWKTFFDVYGNFICNKIPTCESDEILLSEEIFSPLVISEKPTYSLNSIKNVTEVWGKAQEADRYDANCNVQINRIDKKVVIDLSLPLYACDSEGNHSVPYVYPTSELLGFTMPDNINQTDRLIAETEKYPIYLRVNYSNSNTDNLPEILMISDYVSKNQITLDMLVDGLGYCVNPKNDGVNTYALFTGEFQIHAVCMLVDKEPNNEEKRKHKLNYNCNQISYIYNSGNVTTYDINGNAYTRYEEDNCPYTIEKIGELNQKLSGNDYEDIYTTDLARQRAEYEAWKSGRLTDSLTIETRLIPFLDCDVKVKYKSKQTGQVDTYIVDKLQHSFDNFTTTIEMHKFYPTYPFVVNN